MCIRDRIIEAEDTKFALPSHTTYLATDSVQPAATAQVQIKAQVIDQNTYCKTASDEAVSTRLECDFPFPSAVNLSPITPKAIYCSRYYPLSTLKLKVMSFIIA